MIIIPAAGEGRRFTEAGYKGPKHEIDLDGRPMVARVIDNVLQLDVQSLPDLRIFVADQGYVGKTKGAIDTILKVEMLVHIDPNERLVIANCDQLLDLTTYDPAKPSGNGIVFTFKSANPAHSYVWTKKDKITDIIEKPRDPVAQGWTQAVSGVYVFNRAEPFLTACKEAQAKLSEPGWTGAEQYISSALKIMIEQGYGLYAEDVPTAILGTPEDFQRFETALAVIRSIS